MRSLRDIEKDLPPSLVAVAEDAHARGVRSTTTESESLSRMRGAIAAYEYEKQLKALCQRATRERKRMDRTLQARGFTTL